MLNATPIIAFAATANVEAAKQFYRDVLGLTLDADEPFALVFSANGIMLRLQKVVQVVPVPYTTLGWQVDDITTSVAQLAEAGTVCEQYGNLEQNAQGIATFPDGARVAWFRDPDGNLLSLTQEP